MINAKLTSGVEMGKRKLSAVSTAATVSARFCDLDKMFRIRTNICHPFLL